MKLLQQSLSFLFFLRMIWLIFKVTPAPARSSFTVCFHGDLLKGRKHKFGVMNWVVHETKVK